MSFEIRPRIRRAFRLALRRRHLTAADVDDELELHLELRIQQLIAHGLTREQAEVEAHQRFGDSWDQVVARLHAAGSLREERLSMSERLEALTTDLRYATRTLVRQRGFSAVVIATFVLGIGANATMFDVMNSVRVRSSEPTIGSSVRVASPRMLRLGSRLPPNEPRARQRAAR